MAVQDKYADEMLTDDELDQVAGGWFWQGYSEKQMENAGVTWIHNYFSADEFIYKGKNVTSKEAEAVTAYVFFHDMQPPSMEVALKFYNNGDLSRAFKDTYKQACTGQTYRETKKGRST